MKHLFSILVSTLMLLSGYNEVSALSILIRTAEESFRDADAIVIGTVRNIQRLKESDNHFSQYFNYDEIEVDVNEVIKGNVPDQIFVLQWGEGFERWTPNIQEGEDVLLCLGSLKGKYDIVGLKMGKFNIQNGKITNTSVPVEKFKEEIQQIISGERDKLSTPVVREEYRRLTKAYYGSLMVPHDYFVDFGEPASIVFNYNPDGAPADTNGADVSNLIGIGMAIWNNVNGSDLTMSLDSEFTTGHWDTSDQVHAICWTDSSYMIGYWGSNALALGAYHASGDIMFNGSYNWNFSTGGPEGDEIDFLTVLIHELGHTLGLGHAGMAIGSVTTGPVMRPEFAYGVQKRTLHKGDRGGAIHTYTDLQTGDLVDTIIVWTAKDTITFPGDITVSYGKEVQIRSFANIILDGYSLTNTGGTITHLENLGGGTATWIPDIRVASKPDNRYGTIAAAIVDADTTSLDTVFVKTGGTYQDTIRMKSNLTLLNDTGGGYITLDRPGLIVLALDIHDYSIEGFRFTGSSTWAVHIENSPGGKLKNCYLDVSGAWYGIAVVDVNDVMFDHTVVRNINETALILFDSDIEIKNSRFIANDYAIYCESGAEPNIGNGAEYAKADSFFANNLDIYASSFCDNISATYNRFEADEGPKTQHAGSGSGKVIDTDPYETWYPSFKPAPGSDLRAIQAENIKDEGRSFLKARNVEASLMKFDEVVDKYPDTEAALFALSHASSGYRDQERDAEAVVYFDRISSKHRNSEIGMRAEYLSINHRAAVGTYIEALDLADQHLSTYPDSPYAPFILLRKGRIFLHRLKDAETAVETFKKLVESYPARDAVTKLAKGYIAMAEELFGENVAVHQVEAVPVKIERGLGNYPNPFNPSTTIAFSLAQAEQVELSIYNSLGQKIRTLIAGEIMAEGNYNIIWDGKNDQGIRVASGVYLYSLKLRNSQSVQKMVMLK